MKHARVAFRLRWILPACQLLICVAALWPVRWFLFFEISHRTGALRSQGGIIQLSQADLDAVEKEAENRDRLMKVPTVLNFPVVLVEAPYMLAVHARSGHTTGGLLLDTWRALAWPILGIPFWWFVGRAIEALFGARRSVALPRIALLETVLGVLLACIGVVTLVGIITSTPDDRRDFDFLMFVAGGLLWGILGATAVTARVLQWRILRRSAATGQLA